MANVDRRDQMADVWGIERATENADTLGISTVDAHEGSV